MAGFKVYLCRVAKLCDPMRQVTFRNSVMRMQCIKSCAPLALPLWAVRHTRSVTLQGDVKPTLRDTVTAAHHLPTAQQPTDRPRVDASQLDNWKLWMPPTDAGCALNASCMCVCVCVCVWSCRGHVVMMHANWGWLKMTDMKLEDKIYIVWK